MTNIDSMWEKRWIRPSYITKLSPNSVFIKIIREEKIFGECISKLTCWSRWEYKWKKFNSLSYCAMSRILYISGQKIGQWDQSQILVWSYKILEQYRKCPTIGFYMII
jgi:hypothetical protein